MYKSRLSKVKEFIDSEQDITQSEYDELINHVNNMKTLSENMEKNEVNKSIISELNF